METMKKLFSTVLCSAFCLAALAQTATFSSFTYQGRDARFDKQMDLRTQYLNPIISGYYPDPSVVRVGDTYWLVSSTFGYFPGVPLFKSRNLVNWTQVGNVLDRQSQLNLKNADVSGGIFAPQISYNPKNKTYYVTTMNMSTYQVFYVKSKNPEAGWSDPIQMKRGGMDTSFMFDNNGRAWVVYCTRPFDNNAPAGMSAIHLNEFDWRNDSIKSETWELTTGSGCMEQSQWIEGPHLYHIGKYYYLMCAEGGTGRAHSEVIFRSKKVTGPYESYSGNPILTQRDLSDTDCTEPVSSAGHADLVQAKDGSWWAVFLACRPYGDDLYNTGRETFLLPVIWKDGWPIILEHEKAVPTVVNRNDSDPAVAAIAKSTDIATPGSVSLRQPPTTGDFTFTDSFRTAELGPEWLYLRNPDMSKYNFADSGLPNNAIADGHKGRALQITPTTATLSGKDSPSCVFFRQKNTCFTAETELTFEPTDSAISGITVFQSDKNHLVLGKTLLDGKPAIALLKTENGIQTMIGSAFLSSKTIRLRIDGDGRYYSFSYATPSPLGECWGEVQTIARGVDCSCLSTKLSGGFVGTTIGLYVSLKW